jgi:hypothetical protein
MALLGRGEEVGIVFVELGVMGRRYDAVKDVLEGGATVPEVAARLVCDAQSLVGAS